MDILRLGLLGGLLGLDGTSVGQFMVSRPLVAGTLVGWAIGDVPLGLTVGAVLELYLVVSFPTGGSRFPEGATATAVAVATAASMEGAGALPLGIAVGLVWGQVGGESITALRHLNTRLTPEPQDEPTVARVTWGHALAIACDFARGFLVTAVGIWLGRLVVATVGASWPLSRSSSMGLLLVGGAVSAGILLRDLDGFRRRRFTFVAGLALGIIGVRFL